MPTPRTVIVPVADSLLEAFLDGDPADHDGQASIAAIAAAVETFDGPVFLRTGHMSAKHSWDHSCSLTDRSLLLAHLSELYGVHCSAWGLPDPAHIIVREMLATDRMFYAFEGTPITKERRYFVLDGKVYDRQPYWPIAAIEGREPRDHSGAELPSEVWTRILQRASKETYDEHAELSNLSEHAATGLRGAWSLDWLWVPARGWVFIDAAHAEESFVMPEEDRQALQA